MKGRDLTTKKKIDLVDRTVLGTVGSCILKSIAFDFNKYVLLYKQKMHQRTGTRVCEFSGPD